jgi:hypothetical protein
MIRDGPNVTLRVPKGSVTFYGLEYMHRGGAHTLMNREDRVVLAMRLVGEHGFVPCGYLKPHPKEGGRWWVEGGRVVDAAAAGRGQAVASSRSTRPPPPSRQQPLQQHTVATGGGSSTSTSARLTPLVQRVQQVQEALGIDRVGQSSTLADAILQANRMMGLAGVGTLPEQVDALLDAIGL